MGEGEERGGEGEGESQVRTPGEGLTEPVEQESDSSLSLRKRAMSLMKTAVPLKMKDMKRCMWM